MGARLGLVMRQLEGAWESLMQYYMYVHVAMVDNLIVAHRQLISVAQELSSEH